MDNHAVTLDQINYLLYQNFWNLTTINMNWQVKILHQVFTIFFKNEYTDQNTVQLQFLHNLHLTSWSMQPLPPVLEHPGSYQQKILEME